MDEITGGSGWQSWIQGVGANVIDKYASANWVQPFEIQKMRIQALGADGETYYDQGEPAPSASRGGISTSTLLLIGGMTLLGVLAFSKD